jgi:nucleotide-binding universal stress UspA family protein
VDTDDEAEQQDGRTDTADARAVVEHLRGLSGVVVGDDGSPAASTAVRWAADDAARRGSPLNIVRNWSISTAPRPPAAARGYAPSVCEFEDAVRERMEEQWASLRDQVPELRLLPVHQQPAKALIEASESADVVVVGASGRGRVARITVGGVAKDVVRHARCPVVVVPSPRDADR